MYRSCGRVEITHECSVIPIGSDLWVRLYAKQLRHTYMVLHIGTPRVDKTPRKRSVQQGHSNMLPCGFVWIYIHGSLKGGREPRAGQNIGSKYVRDMCARNSSLAAFKLAQAHT